MSEINLKPLEIIMILALDCFLAKLIAIGLEDWCVGVLQLVRYLSLQCMANELSCVEMNIFLY